MQLCPQISGSKTNMNGVDFESPIDALEILENQKNQEYNCVGLSSNSTAFKNAMRSLLLKGIYLF